MHLSLTVSNVGANSDHRLWWRGDGAVLARQYGGIATDTGGNGRVINREHVPVERPLSCSIAEWNLTFAMTICFTF